MLTEARVRELKGPGFAASNVPGYECCRGKVRDMYLLPDRPTELLMVTTDRVSAFDAVLTELIENRGIILNRLCSWWWDKLEVFYHQISTDVNQFPPAFNQPWLAGRCMLVERASVVPFEVIVKGYLCGSMWRDYKEGRRRWDMMDRDLPGGMKMNMALPRPVLMLTTKAQEGHDEPADFAALAGAVGDGVAEEIARKSVDLYDEARLICADAGLLLADCKFEWGRMPHVNNELVLVDEILTPDSARFWPVENYQVGESGIHTWDKDIIRGWLGHHWDRKGTPPPLPYWDPIMYRLACERVYHRLTGEYFRP